MRKRKHRVLRFLLVVLGVVIVSGGAVAFMFRPQPPRLAEPIRIDNGMVQGLTQGGITSYKGIPYAAPPIGDLRWRAPQPVAD